MWPHALICSMKKLFIAVCCLFCLLCITAFVQNKVSMPGDDGKVIALRNVGHKLLLQMGDSTTNLQPVQKLDANTFKIQFSRPFTFEPDSVVKTVQSVFVKNGLAGKYMLKVINSHTNEMIWGYEVVNKPDPKTIPCLGRNQPAGPYFVQVTLGSPTVLASLSQSCLLPGVGLLFALAAMAIAGFYSKKPAPAMADNSGKLAIGRYTLHAGRGVLTLNGTSTRLTAKEVKGLKMFALRPNTIIERQELVQHIWEDEGVIVGGRSLDVFISKLRKKLVDDPKVNIINAHGVGYSMEVA